MDSLQLPEAFFAAIKERYLPPLDFPSFDLPHQPKLHLLASLSDESPHRIEQNI
jgi:hypothetical protein